jgi:hypothetical protein
VENQPDRVLVIPPLLAANIRNDTLQGCEELVNIVINAYRTGPSLQQIPTVSAENCGDPDIPFSPSQSPTGSDI